MITSIYVARVLLEEGAGRVAYAQNIASYFSAFASVGMVDYGLREIARVRDDAQKTNQVFTQLFIINMLLTELSLTAYLLCVFLANGALGETKLMLICGLPILFNAINVDWFYRGNEEYRYIVLRSLLMKAILTIAIFLWVQNASDYVKYAFLLCLITGGNHIVNILHLRNKVRFDFCDFHIRSHISPMLIITLCGLLGTIYNKSDITMLGLIDSEAAVGYYSYAHRTIDIIITTCIAVTSAFLPRLSYYYHNGREKFYKLLDTGVRIIAFFSFPACMGVILIAPELVEMLYGTNFAPSAIALRWFAILIIVKGFGDLLCYQLVLCTGNEKKRIPAYAMAAVTNVVLNLILIPIYSFVGAAIASVISEMIVNGYQMLKMKKEIEFKLDKKAIEQALLSSTIMLFFVVGINHFEISSLCRCVLSVLIGSVVYCFVNLLLKNEIMLTVFSKTRRIMRRKR